MNNHETSSSDNLEFIEDAYGRTQYAPETGVKREGVFEIPGVMGNLATSRTVEVEKSEG